LIARPSGRAISLWDKELARFGKNDAKTILCQEKAKNARVNGTVNKLSTKSGKNSLPLGGWLEATMAVKVGKYRRANFVGDFSEGRIPELSGITGLKTKTAGESSALVDMAR
jgi:hypothetical protein